MTDHNTPLSPRHERFALGFLEDGNATRAYVRAGYSPRGARPSASRLPRQSEIEAAIATALELSVERIGRERARIAFASVDDFLHIEDDGRLRIDLGKASPARRTGIVALKISNHRKPEQQASLKPGELAAAVPTPSPSGPSAAADLRGEKEDHSKPWAKAAPEGLPTPRPHVAGAGNRTIFWRTARQPSAGPIWHDVPRQGARFPGR